MPNEREDPTTTNLTRSLAWSVAVTPNTDIPWKLEGGLGGELALLDKDEVIGMKREIVGEFGPPGANTIRIPLKDTKSVHNRSPSSRSSRRSRRR